MKEISRRRFLRASAMMAVGALAASCGQPTAQVIEKEVPVEKIVKETVVVEKQVPVEKVVKETVVVQKEIVVEKVVTATPIPAKFHEAPMLAELVKAGKLPPVDERLPEDPKVQDVVEEIGQYGGTLHQIRPVADPIGIFETRFFYPNLARWNAAGSEIGPHVASGWDVDAKGTTFTFNLRKGMKWSDGAPYTADDLLFYYEDVLLNKDLTPSIPAYLLTKGQPVKIEKISDYVVRFSFASTHGLFMILTATNWGVMQMGYCKHYLSQFHPNYVAKDKLDAMTKEASFEFWHQLFSDRRSMVANTELPVIYPWQWEAVAPQNPRLGVRNPYYWVVDPEGNQLPYIDRLSVESVESAEVFDVRSIAGEVDYQEQYTRFKNYSLYMENKEKGDYRVILWPKGYVTDSALSLNVAHADPVYREIFGDKRFRYALSLGINRAEIIKALYLGQSEPFQVSPLRTSPFYWEEYATWMTEYDPKRANAYLDEMGLTNRDSDGYRLRPDGKRMTIVYEFYADLGPWQEIGEFLTAQWKELGLEIGVKRYDSSLRTTRLGANEHDLTVWTGNAEFYPIIEPRYFMPYNPNASKGMVPWARWYESGGKSGEEPTGDVMKTVELYEQIKDTTDFEEQKRLFRQMLELNKENLWTIGICTSPPEVALVKNNCRNVPEEAVSDWPLCTPGNTAPDQFFFKS
ncbi:MAG: ABC transporter substrate-binding protein [Chloroflexi bacterium]|nr:ABC transporter substrate-binding protein [Chloroflexota bacterium]